jgi:hypothetical protein
MPSTSLGLTLEVVATVSGYRPCFTLGHVRMGAGCPLSLIMLYSFSTTTFQTFRWPYPRRYGPNRLLHHLQGWNAFSHFTEHCALQCQDRASEV